MNKELACSPKMVENNTIMVIFKKKTMLYWKELIIK
jgi:hypothetical protein